jgi:hypothetical protein
MNRTCRKWKAFSVVVAAWQVGPTAFSLCERCRVSGEAARREGKSAVAAALFEDRSIDRCGGKGSQLA